jgi:CheY-like chemotaxis protein
MRIIRLLVVEDDPAFLHLVRKAFEQPQQEFRWDVSWAASGQEAVNLLFAEENTHQPLPELILLDWNLPSVSGNEVLRRIKGDGVLRSIPVLVFSGSKADSDVAEAYDSHANGFIHKPQDIKLLAHIVEVIGHFWVTVAHLPAVARQSSGCMGLEVLDRNLKGSETRERQHERQD